MPQASLNRLCVFTATTNLLPRIDISTEYISTEVHFFRTLGQNHI
jgi:hypothetical protein